MTNPLDLDGTTAIITGASRGIGFAIARALLTAGARIVINGSSVERTDAALTALREEFGARNVVGVAGDVTDPVVVNALIEEAVATFGGLEHVICNAGIDIIKPAIDYTVDEWDTILRVNLRGAFQPAQSAARWWIANGRPGSITITSSIAGIVGIPTLAPYAASKGGVNQLVRTLAAEWAPYSIRVNAIAPGYVDNIMDSVTAHDNPASDARISTFTPLGRRATTDEIAAPYVFLASPGAAYITGAILPVDGGYTTI